MSQFYTTEQTDELAGIIGERLRTVRTDLTAYVDSTKISQEERDKLAYLESSKFLGTYLTAADIPLEGAISGNYADVDGGIGETVRRWIYDVDLTAFVAADAEIAGETSASIKQKYEDNADTNAFTDVYKTTVEALIGVTPATNIDSFLEAFNVAVVGVVNISLSSLTNRDGPGGEWKSSFYSNSVNYSAQPGDPDHFIEIYANRIVFEINGFNPLLNLLRSEISVTYNEAQRYIVVPEIGVTRVSGTLNVEFYPPL